MTDTSKSHQTASQDGSVLDKARASASHALEVSRGSAKDAARATAQSVDTNPLAVLAGGLALGVLAGAAIPRSTREKELLAPVGKRLAEAAVLATTAARDAGMAELDKRGLTRDAARDQVKSAVDGLGKALSSAGSAAAKKAAHPSE